MIYADAHTNPLKRRSCPHADFIDTRCTGCGLIVDNRMMDIGFKRRAGPSNPVSGYRMTPPDKLAVPKPDRRNARSASLDEPCYRSHIGQRYIRSDGYTACRACKRGEL